MERKINKADIVFPLFLFLCITTSVVPIMLAYDLIKLDTYATFISLLDKDYLSLSYFATIIINNLDYMNFSMMNVLASLLTSLSWMNIVMIILILYLWAAKKERCMIKRNKIWQIIALIYIIAYILITLIIILNFQLTSLNAIITLFYYAGFIMMLAHCSIIIISSYYLIKEIKPIILNIKKDYF